MTLLLVEVPNEIAAEALGRQPGVRVVGVVTPPEPAPADEPVPTPPTPRRWAGSLSDESAESLRIHTEQVRSEWERVF